MSKAITDDLLARLRRHYIKPGAPMPGGLFVTEIGRNGGWGSGRRADALYVGFTSTSGRLLIGHEVKASRADWLNELNKPAKADTWADQCHRWWLVTPPDVVKDGELPHGWGHMVPGRSRTRMKVEAEAATHAGRVPDWDTVRSILAKQDTARAAEIAEIREKATAEANERVSERVEREVEYRMRKAPDAQAVQDRLDQVETALGAAIDFSSREHGSLRWGKSITVADLALISPLVRAAGSLDAAASRLRSAYELNAVDMLRRNLDDYERSYREAIAQLPTETDPNESTEGEKA